MATTVPSRFAVLALDADDPKPKKGQKSSAPVKTDGKNKNDKQNDKPKGQPKKEEKTKKSKNAKKKRSNQENQQWEQWKQKDTMAVEEAYKQELHEAMILSKMAYETQPDNGVKDADATKKSGVKKSKKSTMSLEEFNNMGNDNPVNEQDSKALKHKTESDVEFFERMDKETQEEIMKCKERDMLKKRLNTLDTDINSAQLKVEVEKRNEQILELKDEVETLKAELSQVKERNKKLYQILSLGEMKDKATVLAEVAKLQEIRDELTSEVESLHAQLEQERSKTRASSAEVKSSKQTNKKRPASENA